MNNKESKITIEENQESKISISISDVINHLTKNAADMYAENFPDRIPHRDYNFFMERMNKEYYEISLQRLTSPSMTEISCSQSEYIKTASIRDCDVQYYIRNKIYCFIHHAYEFHMCERFGREGRQNIFKIMIDKERKELESKKGEENDW